MARYCTLARYRAYIKNAKDLNRNIKLSKDIDLQPQTSRKGLWSDIIGYISQRKPRLEQSSNAIFGVTEKHGEGENVINSNKYIGTNCESNRLSVCSKFRHELSQKQNVVWASTGVAAVGSGLDTTTKDTATPTSEPVLDTPVIPEAPTVLEISEDIVEPLSQLNALGEPTLSSLGLGGWSPIGMAQSGFEFLHVALGVDWWAAIAIGTVIIRTCLLPLVVISQRNAAKMNNCLPQMQVLQLKITEARQTGNHMDVARYTQELMMFMKEKQVNPIKNMIVPLAQMPIFISVFMGLRRMANLPVDSLRTGGMFWFTDLTLPDQYFILPVITSLTLLATIEMGTDAARLSSQNLQMMKYVLRAIPFVMLPFIMNFPGLILCYWVSTNFISLVQVGVLRIPRVRKFFKIDPLQSFDSSKLPIKPKGFRAGLKESWSNIKLSRALEERRTLDELQFRKAGKGPITKTYKFDPTKHIKDPGTTTPVSAKKR